MHKIISISGLIGSGKSTAANFLVDNGFTSVAYADTLKDVVALVFGWDRTLLEGDTYYSRVWRDSEDPWWTANLDMDVIVTPRWALTHIGTEIMRNKFHKDVWLLCVKRRISKIKGNIVISDARFLNEIQLVRELGGTTIGIYRKIPSWLEKFYQKTDSHLLQGHLAQGLMEVDLRSSNNQELVIHAGVRALDEVKQIHKVHPSEWTHLLWNDYAKIIDNTGTLNQLHDQLKEFL